MTPDTLLSSSRGNIAARLVAGFLGCGRVPVTPGTAGSVAAVVLGWPLMLAPFWVLPLAAVLATVAGMWAVTAARAEDDPGWVVIDEVAGQWIALLGLAAPSIAGFAAALFLFRLLDITKLGPIGWAERLPGAAGVMADDLLAGAATAVILVAVRWQWPGLLA